jgi:hypothetical protein
LKKSSIKSYLSILLGCISIISAKANKLWYDDYIYNPNIQTVEFFQSGTRYSYPILDLNSPEESLLLSFDDFESGRKDLQFTIIHCNANWEPSDLFSSQYIDGAPYESIINYESSFNTYQKYTHYWFYVPGTYLRPKVTGNYLLKVYYADNDDSILITRRFYVYSNKLSIAAVVNRPTYAKYRSTSQEIDFDINYSGLNLMNPINDIKVVIQQNQRIDNQLTGLRPKFISNNIMSFDYEEENLFDGGNEFRNIDLRSYRNAGWGVKKIYLDSICYNFILYPDDDLSYNSYSSWSDINGERVISGENENLKSNELDYVKAHFRLMTPYPKDSGEVYIFGALTDWRIQERFKMNFNPVLNYYSGVFLLKQGYYNYQYVFVRPDGYIDATRFEGTHYETENDYLLLIYFHTQELHADELMGVSFLNSVKGK